jgi:tetratricopeptide (TPR) repeat protein/DNA-binding winged helix-turn-helix (wHTH) protein
VLIRLGSVHVDLGTGAVTRGPRIDRLTEQQRAVLAYLVERSGEVVPTDQLIVGIWGADAVLPLERKRHRHVLQNVILVIRRAVEIDPKKPRYLRTEAGGYCFDPTGGAFEAGAPTKTNLTSGGALVGRARALAHLATLLDEGAPVCVHGPPGIGKTALVTRFCLGVGGRFRGGGVWLLSLRGMRSWSDLRQAITMLFDLRVTGDDDRLQRALARRGRTLLVLDDADEAPDVAAEALARLTPDVVLWFVARARLPFVAVACPVDPLEPGPAEELFRARYLVATGAPPADRLVWDVARLHGVPGAVVLAADAARWWGPDGTAAVLEGIGPTGVIDALVARAWDACDDAQRHALVAIAVASGSLPADAAPALGVSASALATLCDRGLALLVPAGIVAPRLVADVVRQRDPVAWVAGREAWDTWVVARARALAPAAWLHRGDAIARLRGLVMDLTSIQARASSADVAADALLLALPALTLDDPPGALARVDAAIHADGLADELRARLRLERGGLLLQQMLPELAARDFEAVRAHPGAHGARALVGLGQAMLTLGRLDEADAHLRAAIVAAQAADVAWIEARAHAGMALIHRRTGDDVALVRSHELALQCARRAGDWRTHGRATGNHALWHRRRGDKEQSLALRRLELDAYRKIGDERAMLVTRISIGEHLLDAGDADGARAELAWSLEELARHDLPDLEASVQSELALIDALDGDGARARYRRDLAVASCTEPKRRVEVLVQGGIVEAVVGERAEARRMWEAACEAGKLPGMRRELAWAGALLRLTGDADVVVDLEPLDGWLRALLGDDAAPERAPSAPRSVVEQLVRAIARA